LKGQNCFKNNLSFKKVTITMQRKDLGKTKLNNGNPTKNNFYVQQM